MIRTFQTEIEIAWADCDPAGIVFYPHFFRYMDTAMQRLFAAQGTSQAHLQARFGVVGTPIVEANAVFRSPGRPNELLTIGVAGPAWQGRTFRLDYRGRIGDRVVFEGYEVRVFAGLDGAGKLEAREPPAAFKALFG
jgi:acyl-CoA thioesterase FadM